jgi:hypothetical protein
MKQKRRRDDATDTELKRLKMKSMSTMLKTDFKTKRLISCNRASLLYHLCLYLFYLS